jgi:hypothetical protein
VSIRLPNTTGLASLNSNSIKVELQLNSTKMILTGAVVLAMGFLQVVITKRHLLKSQILKIRQKTRIFMKSHLQTFLILLFAILVYAFSLNCSFGQNKNEILNMYHDTTKDEYAYCQ